MTRRFTAIVTKEEKWYVSRCVELGVVSQGLTIEEAQANLREAVDLYLESFGTGQGYLVGHSETMRHEQGRVG